MNHERLVVVVVVVVVVVAVVVVAVVVLFFLFRDPSELQSSNLKYMKGRF